MRTNACLIGPDATMAELATIVGNLLDSTVEDRTGLSAYAGHHGVTALLQPPTASADTGPGTAAQHLQRARIATRVEAGEAGSGGGDSVQTVSFRTHSPFWLFKIRKFCCESRLGSQIFRYEARCPLVDGYSPPIQSKWPELAGLLPEKSAGRRCRSPALKSNSERRRLLPCLANTQQTTSPRHHHDRKHRDQQKDRTRFRHRRGGDIEYGPFATNRIVIGTCAEIERERA